MRLKYYISAILLIAGFVVPMDASAAIVSAPPKYLTGSGSGLSHGLVGHWTFDGGDVPNGYVFDVSGNGDHGTLSNIATSTFYVSGKSGQAFQFDGSNDEVGMGSSYNGVQTVSFWVKPNTITQSMLELNGSANVQTSSGTVSASGFTSPTIYVDAVVSSSLNNTGKWRHVVVTTGTGINASALRLGVVSSTYFNGTLDDVRTYNRALSATEVRQLYNMGATKMNIGQQVSATTGCSNTGLSCGLIGYWTFDGKDMSNGRLLDASGAGNNATLVAIATSTFYVPGRIGQAFLFDGTNDLVNAGSLAGLDNIATTNGAFTASVWVKLRTYGGGNQGFVIAKETNASGGAGWHFTVTGTNSLITFGANYNTTNLLVRTSLGTFPTTDLNKWVHIAVTWDGSNTASNVHIFKNGVEQTYSTQTNAVGTYNSDAARSLTIGGSDGTGSRFANGTIDDVHVYNRILSASEMVQLYNLGTGKQGVSPAVPTTNCQIGLSCGLAGYWTFDGNNMTNGRANDTSGNANHGNLINIATSTFYVPGKSGQGFRFDGVDDSINTNSTFVSVATAGTKTISAWVKLDSTGSSVNAVTMNCTAVRICGSVATDSNSWITQYRMTGDSSATLDSNISTVAGRWTHVTQVQDGTNIYIYINGVLGNSATNAITNPTVSGIRNTRIGAYDNSGALANFFPGIIDDVRIYSRALSATEVTQLYNQGR